MASPIITDEQFQSIGFTFVREEANIRQYIYQQYYLRYDPVACKVSVTYGRVQVTYDAVYVSIVNNFSQLVSDLVRNEVITPLVPNC